MDDAAPAREDAGTASRRGLTRREALFAALFDGLSEQERSWVIERIGHYRRLAAANEVSEGRI
jgi:hypothetical protein